MRKRIFATLLVAFSAVAFSQGQEPGGFPAEAPPLEYPGEPPYYAAYRYGAAMHANLVTTATDALRNFQQSTQFRDAFTSPALQDKYEEMITSQTIALSNMRRDLLTTATQVNRLAYDQLNTMRGLYDLMAPEFGSEE